MDKSRRAKTAFSLTSVRGSGTGCAPETGASTTALVVANASHLQPLTCESKPTLNSDATPPPCRRPCDLGRYMTTLLDEAGGKPLARNPAI